MADYRRLKHDQNERTFQVDSICRSKKHQAGKERGIRYDYAIVKLTEPIIYDDYNRPACLPIDLTRFKNVTRCFVIGMGADTISYDKETMQPIYTFPETMRQMPVKRVSCNFSDSDKSRHCFTRTNGPGDTCASDTGSPLVCMSDRGFWYLMGLASYGSEGCNGRGSVGWVATYTRIPMLIDEMMADCNLFLNHYQKLERIKAQFTR